MKAAFLIMALAAFSAAVFWAVKKTALRDGGGEEILVVLPVRGHREDVELRVRGLVSACREMRGASVILADFGADSETAEIGRRLCQEFGNVELIDGNCLADRARGRYDDDKMNSL